MTNKDREYKCVWQRKIGTSWGQFMSQEGHVGTLFPVVRVSASFERVDEGFP
jgi:hypothetical protein